MNKFLTTFIILGFTFSLAQAQHYEHFTSWNRFALQKKFNDRWEIMADIQIRRQNDFTSPSINPWAVKFVDAYRITTTYRVKNFAFSFAPFLFHNSPLYAKISDFNRPDRLEIRPAIFTEWTKKLSEKWVFRSRLGYEYRIFRRDDDSWGNEQSRMRLRVQLRYSWDKKNTIFLGDEPLYNLPPNLPANSFNQNQTVFAYNHVFNSHFTFEIGYLRNHIQRASLVEFDEENALQTHFIFRL
jgi:Protein of unknown function (DUF2490)